LGHVLRQQGELRPALAALRRGHELGSRRATWPYKSAQWVTQCERLIALDDDLPRLLAGQAAPDGPAGWAEVAGLCTLKRLHPSAVRCYEKAFAAQPALRGVHGYNAACAAALAVAGRGEDAA